MSAIRFIIVWKKSRLKIVMFISKVFSFFFVCVLAVCSDSTSQTENANQNQTINKPELSVSMNRSHCYGNCPVYDVNIQPDGKILFNGIDFTETKGKVEGSLSEEKIKQLVSEIEDANFFSYKDLYTEDSGNCSVIATDDLTVTLSIHLNGKEKTITHYLGCHGTDNLGKLIKLENKIDEIVETKRWIGNGK